MDRKAPKRNAAGRSRANESTATAHPTKPTIVFQYQQRNMLVPRPTSYGGAVALARKYIEEPIKEIRFLTRVALLEEDVEITPDAWSLVIDDIPALRIEVDEGCDSDAEDTPLPKRVKVEPPREITIFVKTLTGRITTLSVLPTDSVESVKNQIQHKDGLLPEQQTLIFGARQMEDDHKLSDYRVSHESTIWLRLSLRGGKPVIYLYPPTPIDVQVRLALTPQWEFSAVYPLSSISRTKQLLGAPPGQEIQWDVHARPNGLLTDKRTGSDVAYLFWEAETCHDPLLSPPHSRPETPSTDHQDLPSSLDFIPGTSKCSPQDSVLLKVEDVPAYLDRALQVLELHVEARTSFITYWLPDVLKHEFVALRFLRQESYEHTAPLHITPRPDVVSRVFMLFQGVKEHDVNVWAEAAKRGEEHPSVWKSVVGIDDNKQNDTTLFRVLEWGGMECV